jgi:hypothetical protein
MKEAVMDDDDDFDAALNSALDDAEIALEQGKYKSQLRALLALSMSDIQKTVPKVSFTDYSKLLSVVEQASAKNIAQADLVANIQALGGTAVSVAKLVPSLAALFA